jgi:hypothetical protein
MPPANQQQLTQQQQQQQLAAKHAELMAKFEEYVEKYVLLLSAIINIH